MTDRVFPSSKPATTGNTATTNGATAAPTTTATATATATATTKSNLYNPTSRPPYRPPAHTRRQFRRRSPRRMICCCCIWTTITLLILLLVAATAGAALYIFYRPHRPEFTVPSLRIQRLNLTTAADSSSAHLTTLLNLTIISKNSNSHAISFSYDTFTITASTAPSNILLGNATVPGFVQEKKNVTTLRNVVVSGSNDLDAESGNSLTSDLKKRNGNGAVTLKIQVDTKVTVTVGRVKSKRIGIRVTCDEIRGTVPKGKSPTVAVTSGSKCKVDLRIKIWRFTF